MKKENPEKHIKKTSTDLNRNREKGTKEETDNRWDEGN